MEVVAGLTLTGMSVNSELSVEQRSKDWRIGPVVYQVFVDRFAPSRQFENKKQIITFPRKLNAWNTLPTVGTFDHRLGLWSHELEFWGGDLDSLRGKIDYIKMLGADIVYLQPIQQAYTNHKYDAQDYFAVSPEIGNREQLKTLTGDIHKKGLRIMLDGVFNHLGRTAPLFQDALVNPQSDKKDWFFIDPKLPNGYRGWSGVANLPAWRLENKEVRDYLWNDKNSVVRSYLRDGIDGWRLDVAFELGAEYLAELRRAARREKADAAVIGEISGYPSDWFGAVDGVFNFHLMNMGIGMLKGEISGGRMGQSLANLIADSGDENLLRSWLLLDNHDTPRVADVLPKLEERRLAQILQFSLPGSPVIYYGSELGMTGNGDPMNRAPMRWDLVSEANPDLKLIRALTAMRKDLPALRYGNTVPLATDKLFGFVRSTGKLKENVIVLVNPTNETVQETVATRIGRIMSWGELRDVFSGTKLRSITGMLKVELGPKSAMVLTPVADKQLGYSAYDRID